MGRAKGTGHRCKKGRKVLKLRLGDECPRNGKLYWDFSALEFKSDKIERGLCPACGGDGEEELHIQDFWGVE